VKSKFNLLLLPFLCQKRFSSPISDVTIKQKSTGIAMMASKLPYAHQNLSFGPTNSLISSRYQCGASGKKQITRLDKTDGREIITP
jgi:hypothetical protein